MTPLKHPREDQRLEALRSYGVLDTPREAEFDDIVRLSAHICGTPIAVINLIDADRQWFKSEVGLGVRQTPLAPSICAHAILRPGLFEVPDTLADERFRYNPLVTGDPRLRFYAGELLETPEGLPLGTLCVLDTIPRELSTAQREALRTLARQVMAQFELRRHVRAQGAVIEAQEVARHALAKANRAKDEFLAALSHELRTPLAPVLMLTESLEADASLPAAVRSDLGLIRRNVELETRLIDDLLDLTRVAHGKLQLQPRAVDAHDVIRQAYATCRAAEERGRRADLSLDLAADESWVEADPTRLQQVVWNLLKNAIKFTPDGGSISLRTHNDAVTGDLIIEVTDTGIGIPPDLLPTIFNAFEQGDGAVTRQFGGLGLGLAICKAVVGLHGGRIEARSEGKGRGATFAVTLATIPTRAPSEPPAPEAAETAPHGAAGDRRLRILLVEDDEATAAIMARLLGRADHDVRTATSIRSAIDAAEHCGGRFDLVISDLGLPDGSGHVLMEQLRDRYAMPGIALSGYGMEEDVRQSQQSGFGAHLLKPVDLKLLRATIARMAAARPPVTASVE